MAKMTDEMIVSIGLNLDSLRAKLKIATGLLGQFEHEAMVMVRNVERGYGTAAERWALRVDQAKERIHRKLIARTREEERELSKSLIRQRALIQQNATIEARAQGATGRGGVFSTRLEAKSKLMALDLKATRDQEKLLAQKLVLERKIQQAAIASAQQGATIEARAQGATGRGGFMTKAEANKKLLALDLQNTREQERLLAQKFAVERRIQEHAITTAQKGATIEARAQGALGPGGVFMTKAQVADRLGMLQSDASEENVSRTKKQQHETQKLGMLQARAQLEMQKALGKTGHFWGDLSMRMGRALRQVALYGGSAALIYGVVNALRATVSTAIKMEDVFARLARVGGPGAIGGLRKTAFGISSQLGIAPSEVATAMQTVAAQYKNPSDISSVTTAGAQLSKLSGKDLSNSISDVISSLEQLNIPASQAVTLVDKFAKVSANAAVTVAQLQDAVSAAGENATEAGLSFDELNGIIAALASSTNLSGRGIATFLNRMFERATASDNIDELDRLGIFMRSALDPTQFRSMSTVLSEVSGKWETYNDSQQKAIAKAFVGQKQQQNFMTLMEKWDKVLEATAHSMNSAG